MYNIFFSSLLYTDELSGLNCHFNQQEAYSAVQFNYKQQAKVDDKPLSHHLVWDSLNAAKKTFISIFFLLKLCPRKCKDVVAEFNHIPLNPCVNFQGKCPMTWPSWVLLVGCRFAHQRQRWGKKGEILKNKPVNKIYGTLLVVRS